MSQRQWKTLEVLGRLARAEMTGGQAAKVLSRSERQVRRLRRRHEREGKAAVIHGGSGREPANKLRVAERRRIMKLAKGKYRGLTDQHLHEKLSSDEGVRCSVRTLRRLLRAAGLTSPKKKRPPRHRRRRERKAQFGLMLLWDGSTHDWLEGRGPRMSLVAALDDATSRGMPGARFWPQECSAAYLHVVRETVRTHGIPMSVYMDRHGIFKRNDDKWTAAEELRGEQDPTQVGRALKTLGIEAIYAMSPQAKGRVERMWDTLQDRLVSELRLAGARTQDQANAVLDRVWPEVFDRFSVAAADPSSFFRPLPRGTDLDRICSFRYDATIRHDNTIRIQSRILDIPPGPGGRGYPGQRVEVRRFLTGEWRIYWNDRLLTALPDSSPVRAAKRKHASVTWTAFAAQIHQAIDMLT